MIVSGIWSRRAEALLRGVSASLPLLALAGCGLETLLFGGPPPSPPPEPLPPPRSDTAARMELEAGLASLPSSRQVLTSVSFGRNDPFAAPPAALPAAVLPASRSATPDSAARSSTGSAGRPASAAARPAAAASAPGRNRPSPPQARSTPLKPPKGFEFTGVIRSGGKAEALVSYGSSTGTLRPGDRGGRTTALLPAGWSLGGIQFEGASPADPPSITLLNAGQRVKVSL